MTLPIGEKIASRNKARKEWERLKYRLVCKACGVVMNDEEPMQSAGSFTHPRIGCKRDGQSPVPPRAFQPYHVNLPKRGSAWVEVFQPKKYRRARAQARKQVRKTR